MTPEWMDSVCIKGGWDVVLSKDGNGTIEGALIFHKRKYRGFNLILMPPLTSYSGIYFNYPLDLKAHSKVSFEVRVINDLLSQLPKHDFLYLQLHPSVTNSLPFYWNGYDQSTRYTYKIDTSRDEEFIWNNLKGNVRRNIRNAEDQCVVGSADMDVFWEHAEASYAARKKENPFNKEVLENLHTSVLPLGRMNISIVKSSESGKVLGGAITVSDNDCTYYLAGFYYPNTQPKYAFSYLLWYLIKNNPQSSFDLEGSIIPEIEQFFRSFGGELTPHFKVWKVNSFLLKWLFKFKTPSFLR